MRKFLVLVATWFVLCGGVVVAQQILPGFPPGAFSNKAALDPAPGSGGCSAATTFLARTAGLSGTETAAYTTMICGMITDGVGCSAWSGSSGNLDTLYIFATKNTATAELNLCSTSYSITPNATLTFTADTGWAGDGSTGYLDTGFNPDSAAGNCALNSCSIGIYDRSASTPGFVVDMGGASAGGFTTLFTPYASGTTYWNVNTGGGNESGAAQASSQGSWVLSRTGASVEALYLNGNTTPVLTGTIAAGASLPGVDIFISAYNSTLTTLYFTSDQNAAAFIGGGLTATQVALIASRINAYMTALGVNVY